MGWQLFRDLGFLQTNGWEFGIFMQVWDLGCLYSYMNGDGDGSGVLKIHFIMQSFILSYMKEEIPYSRYYHSL